MEAGLIRVNAESADVEPGTMRRDEKFQLPFT